MEFAASFEHPEVTQPQRRIHLDHLVRDHRPDEGDVETDLELVIENIFKGIGQKTMSCYIIKYFFYL